MPLIKQHPLISSALLVLVLLLGLALVVGPSGLGLPSFSDKFFGIIISHRLIRAFLAIIAGSSLAASGVSLQAIFRNPLADPHLFGISAGASVGASIVIAFASFAHAIMPSIGAIIGGLCTFLVVFYFLHRTRHHLLSHSILVGVLINSLAAAIITVLKTILPAAKTQSLLFWLVGSISVLSEKSLLLITPVWLIGMTILWRRKSELEILSFGIEESKLLGIDTEKVIKQAVVANCLLIGNTVAFAGIIGFIGLVIPHLVRLCFSNDLRTLLPLTAFAGAIFLLFFDTLSRFSFSLLGSEIPVGALCALFLAPCFFILLLKNQRHD